jgi:hypothetical protein
MSVRPTSRPFAVVALVAAMMLGGALVSPARALTPAVAPPAVSGLTIGTQSQAANHTWVVPVSWSASAGATGYTVSLTNTARTVTYRLRDVSGVETTFVTDDLVDGRGYKVVVVPFTGDEEGPEAWAPFTAITLDRTPPSGAFTVSPTHVYLALEFLFEETEDLTASVLVKQSVTPTDDSPGAITREVVAGDGTPARPWTSGSTTEVTYTRPGTFVPAVRITDAYGNVATLSLAPVTVSSDTTGPIVRVTLPAASVRDRIAGWRVLRGTASDSGAGLEMVFCYAVQKRGRTWYVYDFDQRAWLKGGRRLIRSVNRTPAMPAVLMPSGTGRWRTPRIRGLRVGRLAVLAVGVDLAGNGAMAPIVRHRITRR